MPNETDTNLPQRTRVDLHVHSTGSGPGGGPFHRLMKSLDSYTDPEEVYRLAKRRGMDFVTITDHDSISGAEQLADRPDCFISEEITTGFPEDGVGVHVVALDVSPVQHTEVQRLRESVYDVVHYLRSEHVVHFVAHPFYPVTTTPTIEHFEKLLLLFEVFEVKNGGVRLHPDNLLEQILDRLTPEMIWRMADTHGIEPVGVTPWIKSEVAGSDDHAGLFIGFPYTSCAPVKTVAGLMDAIRAGWCRAEGPGGSALMVAHSALAVAYRHFNARRGGGSGGLGDTAWCLLGQLLDNANPDRSLTAGARVALLMNETLGRFRTSESDASLRGVMERLFTQAARDDAFLRTGLREGLDFNPQTNELMFRSVKRLVDDAVGVCASAIGGSETVLSLLREGWGAAVSGLMLAAPYLAAYREQGRSRAAGAEARQIFLHEEHAGGRMAVVCDDATQHGDIENRLQRYVGGRTELRWLTWTGNNLDMSCRRMLPVSHIGIKGQGVWPVPSLLGLARVLGDDDLDSVYLDAPGPLSIATAAVAFLLGIPIIARFSNDTPNGSARPLNSVPAFVRLFYGRMDEVWVDDADARAAVEALGVDAARIQTKQVRQTAHTA